MTPREEATAPAQDRVAYWTNRIRQCPWTPEKIRRDPVECVRWGLRLARHEASSEEMTEVAWSAVRAEEK